MATEPSPTPRQGKLCPRAPLKRIEVTLEVSAEREPRKTILGGTPNLSRKLEGIVQAGNASPSQNCPACFSAAVEGESGDLVPISLLEIPGPFVDIGHKGACFFPKSCDKSVNGRMLICPS